MSYLLFMDESGHDHKNTPYEVRGGVALHASRIWAFVKDARDMEVACFGDALHKYRSEVKGAKLLCKERFAWASQGPAMEDTARRKHCLAFLNKSHQGQAPTRAEFTAYGQACLAMVSGIFTLLREHEAVLFAAAIPQAVVRPDTYEAAEYLRKDQVFLLERFFYFLEGRKEQGILVMDETEKQADRRFVERLQRYFTKTQTGLYRTAWIVPAPFFVSSELTSPVQAADICIYCINWGFRLPSIGMDAKVRPEIAKEFEPWLRELQFKGEGYKDGKTFDSYGIVYVPDPYEKRK